MRRGGGQRRAGAVLAGLLALVIALTAPAAALGAQARVPGVAGDPAGPGSAPCATAALFAVPASGETTAEADPAVPVGLLAGLTAPLSGRWGERLHVEFVPYPASIEAPLLYPFSEARGVAALERAMAAYDRRCPATLLTVVGYSQGADVASDLVHRSARGTVALDPDQFAGVVLLGNPRRDPDAPNLVAAPGRGILGPRPTAELEPFAGRVYEVCAPDDPICATESLDLRALREGLASGEHRSYATLPVGPDGAPLFTVLGNAYDALLAAAGA